MQFRDFRDENDTLIIKNQEVRAQIPLQLDQALVESIETAAQSSSSLLGANFILNLVLGQSMGPLIGSIQEFQIILHLCLIDVTVPANA